MTSSDVEGTHGLASHRQVGGDYRPYMQQQTKEAATEYWNPNSAQTVPNRGEAAAEYWNPNSASTVPNRNELENGGSYDPRPFIPAIVSLTSL